MKKTWSKKSRDNVPLKALWACTFIWLILSIVGLHGQLYILLENPNYPLRGSKGTVYEGGTKAGLVSTIAIIDNWGLLRGGIRVPFIYDYNWLSSLLQVQISKLWLATEQWKLVRCTTFEDFRHHTVAYKDTCFRGNLDNLFFFVQSNFVDRI